MSKNKSKEIRGEMGQVVIPEYVKPFTPPVDYNVWKRVSKYFDLHYRGEK